MNKIIDFDINTKEEDKDRVLQIEELCKNNIPLNNDDINTLLSNLSYQVRKKIADYEGTDIQDYSYSYKCDLAQSMIYYYLENLNIKSNPVNTNEVIEGVSGHSFIIANINTTEGEKRYLIDPTYIQFFTKEKCSNNNFIIINDKVCVAPDPGYFVVNGNKNDIMATMSLLQDGYIEFTEEVAKAYGDSFFKTKQGTSPNQIDNNTTTGSNYIKWFKHTTSKLSKSKEELANMNLLIDSNKKSNKRKI